MQHSTTCHLLYKEMGPIRRETIFKKENSENVLLKAGITVFNSKDITTETLFLPCKLCRLTCCGHQDPCLKNWNLSGKKFQVPNSKLKQNTLNWYFETHHKTSTVLKYDQSFSRLMIFYVQFIISAIIHWYQYTCTSKNNVFSIACNSDIQLFSPFMSIILFFSFWLCDWRKW